MLADRLVSSELALNVLLLLPRDSLPQPFCPVVLLRARSRS